MPLRGESELAFRAAGALRPGSALRRWICGLASDGACHQTAPMSRSGGARDGHAARREEAVQMRIGLIAPPWVPVPPPAYGGTEVVIDNLARGLQDLGHEVRLFTVGESECPVPIDFVYPQPQAPIGNVIQETAHVLAAYESLATMDIIHDHTFLGPLIAGLRGMRRPPVVATNHGPFNGETQPVLNEIAKHASIVAISHSQARQAQAFGGVAIGDVIHHG